MKYKILSQTDTRVELFVLCEDNTFTVLNLAQDTLENMLKNAYILSKNIERLQYEGKVPTDLEEWNPPKSIPTRMTVDFYNLNGKVYDQYGDEMDITPTFTIEGEHAKIENGKLIEDVVDTDTFYFIVAKYDDLEERQERYLYAPQKDEDTTSLEAEVAELRATVDALLGVENE